MSEVLQIYIISMIDPENRRAEHICGHEERAGLASYEERMSANKRWVRARRVASCRVLSRPASGTAISGAHVELAQPIRIFLNILARASGPRVRFSMVDMSLEYLIRG